MEYYARAHWLIGVKRSMRICEHGCGVKFMRSTCGKSSTGGSAVEFSPATWEARVRFPASADLPYAFLTLKIFFNCFKYTLKINHFYQDQMLKTNLEIHIKQL